MKKSRLLGAVSKKVCVIVLSISAGAYAHANTVTYVTNLPTGYGNVVANSISHGASAVIPQFDPSLGTLANVSINYTYSATIDAFAWAEDTIKLRYDYTDLTYSNAVVASANIDFGASVSYYYWGSITDQAVGFLTQVAVPKLSVSCSEWADPVYCESETYSKSLFRSPIDGVIDVSAIDLTAWTVGSRALYFYELNRKTVDIVDCGTDLGDSCGMNVDVMSETSWLGSQFYVTYQYFVPVPTSLWLFGSGLLGLVGTARKKKAT